MTRPATPRRHAAARLPTPAERTAVTRRLRTLIALTFALPIVALAAPALAHAQSTWWQLESGARPSHLHKGVTHGTDAVQTIKLSTEEPVRVVLVSPNLTAHQIVEEEFFGPGQSFEIREGMSALEVQEGIASIEGYGIGNVQAEELSPTEYRVKFIGALAEHHIPAIPLGYQGVGEVIVDSPGSVATDGELYVTAENLGNKDAEGASEPVKVTDTIPSGLKAVAVGGSKPWPAGDFHKREKIPCELTEVSGRQEAVCTLDQNLAPYDLLEMRIPVLIQPDAGAAVTNEATVAGGASTPATITRPITISETPVPFEANDYEMSLEEEGGEPVTQAGAHPFQFTTTIEFNQLADLNGLGFAKPEVPTPALTKDVHVNLPTGLIGNPQAIPACSDQQFFEVLGGGQENRCPADTAVGVSTATVEEPVTSETAELTEPVFNMEPHPGEPARFGFFVAIANSPVFIDTAVRSGSDYGVTATVSDVTQTASFLASAVTFWGVPGDPRHEKQRGYGCLNQARGITLEPGINQLCNVDEEAHPKPFLSAPGRCERPLASTLEYDSWQEPGVYHEKHAVLNPAGTLTGCNQLEFKPSITVKPDTHEASRPSGLNIDIHDPQEGNENPLGEEASTTRNIAVTFPKGMGVNPSAADGLQACTETLAGLTSGVGPDGEFLFTATFPEPEQQGVNVCPDAAKVGTVTIKSPLLPKGENVEGGLYLATPAPNEEPGKNPFDTLLAGYILARDPISGVDVKLPGKITLDPSTGQISSVFATNPQLPYEDAEIHLLGGERAPLSTPAHCGTYETVATFTPWSATPPVTASSSFQITSGPGGGPCPPAVLPFTPTLTGGSTNISAGQFTPLSTTISREDGNQSIKTVQLHFPNGLSGLLTGVKLCAEAQADAGTCGPESLIGHTTVGVGVGSDPFSVTGGTVYLTEHYRGAPFGLSIVTPAVAGPFNLGLVVVRAKVEVDPRTAALTVTTDEPPSPYAIPTILKGIPLQIKHVNVLIDRPGFTFNPTSCEPTQITGQILSSEGAAAPVAERFQLANCAALKFTPKVAVSTAAKASKANGASLNFKIAYPKGAFGHQAWFNQVKLVIPKQLPSRLTTLQKACLARVFETERQNCPAASTIGHATVHTEVLPVPLEGPLYFVSYGGAAFPDVVMLLKGYGITIELHGNTLIRKGVTSATFKNTPDVPFESIEVTVPQGKYSEFGANLPHERYDFCGQHLIMPTELKASNGLEIHQNTPITATGCPKAKSRAQMLAAALKACRRKHANKRASCERAAHRRYPAKAAKKHR